MIMNNPRGTNAPAELSEISMYSKDDDRLQNSGINRSTEKRTNSSPLEVRDENRNFLSELQKAIDTIDDYTRKLEKKDRSESENKVKPDKKEKDETAKQISAGLGTAAELRKSEEKLLSVLQKLENQAGPAKTEGKSDKLEEKKAPLEDKTPKAGKRKKAADADIDPESVIPGGASDEKQSGGSKGVENQSKNKALFGEQVKNEATGTNDTSEPIGGPESGEKKELKTSQSQKAESGFEMKSAEASAHPAAQKALDAAENKKQRADREKGSDRNRTGEIREVRQAKQEKLTVEVKPAETAKNGNPDTGTKDGSFLEQGKSGSRSNIPAEFTADTVQQDSASFKSRMVSLNHTQELAGRLRESVNSEIVRQAKIILKDASSGEIRLVLKPENLGNVRIRLDLQDNVIGGKIIVENSTVREIFRENIEHLQKAFAAQGMEAGALDVSVAGGESGTHDEQADNRDLSGSQVSSLRQMESNVPSVEIIREGSSLNMII